MHPVSAAYQAAIDAATRDYYVDGVVEFSDASSLSITEDDWLQGSLSFDNQAVNGQALSLGAVYAGQVKLTLVGVTDDRYTLYGARLTFSFHLRLAGGAYETVPMGTYIVTEAQRSGIGIAITAIDEMTRTDVPCELVAYEGSPYDWLTFIASASGLTLAQTQAEIEAMPNGTRVIEIPMVDSGITTIRDLLVNVTQVLAGFATIDRSGHLSIRQFATTPMKTVSNRYCKQTQPSDYTSSYTSVTVERGSGYITLHDDPDDGLNIMVKDNSIFNVGVETDHLDTIQEILGAVSPVIYVPGTYTYFGDPALDLGDMITVQDVVRNVSYNVLITGIDYKYRGEQVLKSVGENPLLGKVQSLVESKLRRDMSLTKADISNIKGELTDVGEQIIQLPGQIMIAVASEYVNAGVLATYIRFDINGITIGKLNDPFEVLITNEKMSFRQDGVEVAYLSNNKLYITNSEVLSTLKLGKYAFIPRNNGNTSWKWVG